MQRYVNRAFLGVPRPKSASGGVSLQAASRKNTRLGDPVYSGGGHRGGGGKTAFLVGAASPKKPTGEAPGLIGLHTL